ncbi:hypothetical protein FQR65_LT02611 [Abscondita terminalis]|nr:hypothetical protein FQR65_LT02611 [Abscondita terminalis]
MLRKCVTSFWCTDQVLKCEFVDVPITETCFGCICRATGCNTDVPCENDACGAFRITKPYWIDSGNWTYNSHSPENPESFVKCATNFYCSVITMQEYMKKFKRDCNGDGKIDCDDFVAIHKLGFANCSDELPENYFGRYDYCQSVVSE